MERANGLRHRLRGCTSRVGYPQVGGTRGRHFDGTSFKPRKVPENAQTPTTTAPAYATGDRVHAVLGGSSLPCSITEENCTIGKAAFHQKLELQSHVVRQG